MIMTVIRGKRVDNGEWVYGMSELALWCKTRGIQNGECEMIDEINNDGSTFKIDPKSMGRYAGHNDKNGKRIFEGDILVLDGYAGCFLVYYDHKSDRFVMDNDKLVVDFSDYYRDSGEIIGNIHDNRDLWLGYLNLIDNGSTVNRLSQKAINRISEIM
ncbi:MAG: hypothetical protein J1F18_15695 [Lachnospiraceae bacterium]|nr:hypothetical protein [Lachnospiraceae bacterium]